AGHVVTAPSRSQANLLDAADRARMLDTARPQTIVHCAWVTDHGAYWTAAQNLDWAAGTLSLVREARERGTTRFIGVGTCAEYEWGSDEPLSETAPTEPATLYGIAKDGTRRTIEAYAALAGLSFAWARVFMLYGAGEHPNRLVPSLARALVRGEPAKMSSGRAIRDFLDARDVGAAIAALAQSTVTGPVNIASGVPVSLAHVGATLARIAGRPDLLQRGAIPDAMGEPATLVANVRRLAEEVRFVPSIPLEQGLADALDHWRAQT
ncbi:MAG: NAD-dependent epimerase/dehydratase, partial [Alphaproteobacteria bacterium]|nr:NAD-dependent epimerase/dehydratase [Alphaproteobacteria bacterium]